MTTGPPTAVPLSDRAEEEVLTLPAREFLEELHHRFEDRRQQLLRDRARRHAELLAGGTLDFLADTAEIRAGSWTVAEPRGDYIDRRVEITGPTDRKLVINALNSGAKGFMADFEDANSPTWSNQVEGHVNLIDAVDGTISYESSDGRHYELGAEPARLLVRPRGWHLDERHLRFGDAAISGSLFDFGLACFHLARRLAAQGSAMYLYLPKLEHHLEARLWNDVFAFSEQELGLPPGSIRATVLIETLPAAFQMDELLYELRDHSYGLNAGRWDYIFSTIKSFRTRPEFVLPDRGEVKMTVPFMRSYTELLVRTCHARGTFAMGGMAALIPSRTDPDANQRAVDAVRADKRREAADGFDGTWVAHPDVVEVATREFDAILGERPNQISRTRDDVHASAADLLNVGATPGSISEQGLRNNISVGFRYLSFWLSGRGAAGIDNMMEDAATAEISRSQIWQWVHHSSTLDTGEVVTRELVLKLLDEEMSKIRADVGEQVWERGRPAETRALFEQVALADDFVEFLTLPAYGLLP